MPQAARKDLTQSLKCIQKWNFEVSIFLISVGKFDSFLDGRFQLWFKSFKSLFLVVWKCS